MHRRTTQLCICVNHLSVHHAAVYLRESLEPHHASSELSAPLPFPCTQVELEGERRHLRFDRMEQSIREHAKQFDDLKASVGANTAALAQVLEAIHEMGAPAGRKAAPVGSSKPAPLDLDSPVLGNWKGRGNMYEGSIAQVNADGTYHIQYDDGDFEEDVPRARIQSRKPASVS